MYDVYSPFDIEQHKKTYINYLEVIIIPDGTVMYAVPSHQMAVENYLMRNLDKTRDDVRAMCPVEMWGDYSQWLCDKSGCIMMWDRFFISPSNMTNEQVEKIKELQNEGLFRPVGGLTWEEL